MKSANVWMKPRKPARFVQQFGNQLAKLEPIVSVLQKPTGRVPTAKRRLRVLSADAARCPSAGVCPDGSGERRAHFSYSDSAEMLSGNSDLNEKLRERLEQAEAEAYSRS